jgi:hypothetical protein
VLTIKVAPSVLSAWADDEYASYEDAGCPAEGHVYNVLSRHKGKLELLDQDEVRLVTKSAAYHGNVYAWDDRKAYRKAVARIGEVIASTPA